MREVCLLTILNCENNIMANYGSIQPSSSNPKNISRPFSSTEFFKLKDSITINMGKIVNECQKLATFEKMIGTKSDTHEFRSSM